MREVLNTLEQAYGTPVDIEFTANFLDGNGYRFHLLQCRPLQVQGGQGAVLPVVEVDEADRILEARGAIIGPSRLSAVDRLVYVVPARYCQLTFSERYEVARLLGRINQATGQDSGTTMLLGPGRWGTASPDLGVPVHFTEISRVSILCEIVTMRENLIPDVSLGTHFLNELVEMNILYMAIFSGQRCNHLNEQFFLDAPNRLYEMVPSAARCWQEVVRVIDSKDVVGPDHEVLLLADAAQQEARMFIGVADLLSP